MEYSVFLKYFIFCSCFCSFLTVLFTQDDNDVFYIDFCLRF